MGIVYTSGTTGVPKGVVLTHDNITSTAQSVYHCADFKRGEDMFVFLPLAHVFARTSCYTAIKTGNRTTFARSIDTLMDDFVLAAPHWFVSVPRVFEKIHTKIISGAEAKGGAAEKIFNWACRIGSQVSACKLAGQPIPFGLWLKYTVATKLVFSKIHKALGGNVKWCISGAAPLNPEIAQFFHAAGILILEGLGMTENTSFSNVNRPDNYDFGVVGPPGGGLFHKIAPSRIEGIMTTSKYINQVCVVGDKRKYLSAVVALDAENIRDYADSHQIVYKTFSDLVGHPDIKALIDSEVKKKNQGLPSFETLKRVTIVPEFTIENAMMTPTFKLKKNIIFKNYENDIETMYGV